MAEVVSKIQPLRSDPNQRRIYVGRRAMATLRATDIESLHLSEGVPWDVKTARAVLDAAAANKARTDAMRLLGRLAHSRAELIAKLQAKGYQPHVAERIAGELVVDGWIDDRAFGEALAEQSLHRKPASRAWLNQKLQSHRIAPELAEEISAGSLAGRSEFEDALTLARRGLKRAPQAASTRARRIAGLLARRGFDDDITEAVLNRLSLDPDSQQE